MDAQKESNIEQQLRTYKLDEALSETKFGIFNCFLIFTSGLILSTVLLETIGISYVLPISQCDIELTTSEKGAVNSIGFIGIIISSHFWGYLADTIGRRKIMAPALFLAFIFSVISSFYINFWMLIIFRFLTSFFISAGSATIYAYVSEFHSEIFRSRAIMAASFIFGIGCTCLPLLTWLVLNGTWSITIDAFNINFKPWRLLIVVFGIPDLICSICLWFLPESPKFLFSIGKQDEALNVLKTVYHLNTRNDKNTFLVTALENNSLENSFTKDIINLKSNAFIKLFKSIWIQTAPLFSKKYLHSTLIGSLMQFIIFFTMQGLYVWFPYILNSLNEFRNMYPNNSTLLCDIMYIKENELILGGIDEQDELKCKEKFEIETYITSFVLECLYIVGFGAVGLLINKVGKVHIIYTILIICGLCGILCNFIKSPLITGYLIAILLADGIVTPVVNAATVDLYPTNLRAMALCISLMFGRLGSVAGSNIVGLLLEINCEMAFYVSGGSLIVAAFLGFIIPKPSL